MATEQSLRTVFGSLSNAELKGKHALLTEMAEDVEASLANKEGLSAEGEGELLASREQIYIEVGVLAVLLEERDI